MGTAGEGEGREEGESAEDQGGKRKVHLMVLG